MIELLATHLEASVLATELVRVGCKWLDEGENIRLVLNLRQADHLFDSAKRSIRTDLALSAAYDRAYGGKHVA